MNEYLTYAPVASAIFAITIVISFFAFSNPGWIDSLILHPYSVARKKRAYTVITSGFIHNDWMHLIFNMFSFFAFAFALESNYMGHWQFAALYIGALILSDLPTVYKHRDDYGYRSLGASGAVSAVIFSMILFDPGMKLMIMPVPFGIPALLFGPLYLIYCHFASKHARDNVNHDAHLYGALSGLLITMILHPMVVHSFIGKISAVIQSWLH